MGKLVNVFCASRVVFQSIAKFIGTFNCLDRLIAAAAMRTLGPRHVAARNADVY